MVPTMRVSSVLSDGLGRVAPNPPTPIQQGITSRVGASLVVNPPWGMVHVVTGWGLAVGAAPAGSSMLTVLARGFTFVRGFCYSVGGHARATAELRVSVEEFIPVKSVGPHSGPGVIDLPDTGTEHAEIAPLPTTMLGTFRHGQTVWGPRVIIINQETSGLGVQYFESNAEPDDPGLFTPITPGNFYRVWILAFQDASCQANGDATSNIAFDFGPVFFGFT
jgi:hypothetical protein